MLDRDKAKLFPPFRVALDQFEEALAAAKLPFFLFEACRSPERQRALWDQGRAKPGAIVTLMAPGLSFHDYGLAADYVLDGMPEKPGIQWSWETKGKDPLWKAMADCAVACGLEAGYYWARFPDLAHVQLRCGLHTNDFVRATQTADPRAVVWDAAYQFLLTSARGR